MIRATLETLGRELRFTRLDLGLTLKDAADEAGISTAYLCHLELGRRKRPSLDVLSSLSRAYGERIRLTIG